VKQESFIDEEPEQTLMAHTPLQTNFGEVPGEYCAIRTTTVYINCNGKKKRIVVAMDPCSNSTNIDEDFAREMGLKVIQTGVEREINFLERSAKIPSVVVSFMLSPLSSNAQYPVNAFTVKNLIKDTTVVNWKKVAEDYPHLQKATIPKPHEDDRVQILLGTDYAHLNGTSHGLIGQDFEPIAELTKLGWAFSGRIKSEHILASWQTKFGVEKHILCTLPSCQTQT
jgi:hypothetical protein